MKRRDVLVGAATGAATVLAGCLGGEGNGGDDHGTMPVIDDGVAYYGREDGFIYAVDLEDQRERWRFDTGGRINFGGTAADGLFYTSNLNGRVYAIEMASGTPAWHFDTDGGGLFSGDLFVPVHDGGVLYFANNGTFYAVDATTGRVRWTAEAAWTPLFWRWSSSFQSAVSDGLVYFCAGHDIHVVEVATGDELARLDTGGSASSPTVADGRLYVGAGSHLLALDTDELTERWRVDTGGKIWFPVRHGDAVYVPNDAGTLSAIDAESGDIRWQYSTDGNLHSPAAVGDQTVVFGSHDGYVYAVDRDTGTERWRYEVGPGDAYEGMDATPTVVEDRVYFATLDRTLVALELKTGAEQARIQHI